MKFKDQFRFVRQNTKKNKSRLFMTVLATAIAVAFLMVLASVAFGLHKSIIADLMQDRMVTEINVHGKNDPETGYKPIIDEDIEYFETIENVKAITRRQHLRQSPEFIIENYSVNANTMVAYFPEEMKAGFELSEGKMPEKDNEIVVGYSFSEELVKQMDEDSMDRENLYDEDGKIKEEYTYKGDILGKTVEMQVYKLVNNEPETKKIPLTVVGIAKKPSREWMMDSNVYISEAVLHEVETFTGTRGGMPEVFEGDEEYAKLGERNYDEVYIYASNVEAVKEISKQLEDKNYYAWSVVSEMKEINMIFNILKAGVIFIGTIALIIASIGIFNTMTMAVTERAPDIGIMKAIGANPKTIKNIFLLESSYIGLLGALFGAIVAYGISFLVNLFLPMILAGVFEEEAPEGFVLTHIPLSLTAISVGICLIVTIFSGWRPAQRATKVDVLKAMRREI